MSFEKRSFERGIIEELQWGSPPDGYELVEKTFSRTSRWAIWYHVVFSYGGQLWRVELNEPATEMQEADWPEELEAEPVTPVTVECTVYSSLLD